MDANRDKTIEVTPIDQWWLFKKPPRDDGKLMSVKEAEELMKVQENFMGPLSLANKIMGKKSLVRRLRVPCGDGCFWCLRGAAVVVGQYYYHCCCCRDAK